MFQKIRFYVSHLFQFGSYDRYNKWTESLPIIVAEFPTTVPDEIIIGDGEIHGGFANPPLLHSSYYYVFLREVIYDRNVYWHNQSVKF